MGLAALSPGYWWVVLFVVVSGLGTAARHHPEGSKFAAYAGGAGGRAGCRCSRSAATSDTRWASSSTPIVVALGIEGGALVVLPCLVGGGLLWLVPFLLSFVPDEGAAGTDAWGDDRLGAMALLLGVVTVRSVAWFGLITFVPLWEVSIRLRGLREPLPALGHAVAGAVRHAARRPGRRSLRPQAVLLVSNIVVPPAIAVFILAGGVASAAALVLIAASWARSACRWSWARSTSPPYIGAASGLVIGLSIGLGGIAAVLLGAVADAVDLETALACAAAPIAGVVLTLLLPPTGSRPALAPEVASP